MNQRSASSTGALILLLTCLAAPGVVQAEAWSWAVEPYAWASNIRADLRTDVPPIEGSSELRFRDILDKLDGSLQLHVEGGLARHGLFLDFSYLGISDRVSRNFADYEADLDTRLFEAAWVWSPSGRRLEALDLFAGVRYLDADISLRIDPVDPELVGRTLDVGDSYLDAMLGARYTWPLGPKWRVTARGDGSFGDTEGAWNASLGARYHTSNGAWVFGYRHLRIEIESGGADVDLTMSGPFAGYAFVF